MNTKDKWIKLSILSLAISGLYSIFIVLLRTPFLSNFFTNKLLFQTALIVHVDLSVLFWMVCFVMMLITDKFDKKYAYIVNVIQNLLFLSIGLIFISPFAGESTPYMNNYVPILHNIFFIIAIGIFIAAFLIISFISIFSKNFVSISLGVIGLATIISFITSIYKLSHLPYPMDQHSFYEMLFWGGGHILQFLYCGGLIVAWYEFASIKRPLVKLEAFLGLNTFIVLPLPFIQMFLGIDSSEYFNLFTQHMKIFGAIAPLSLLLTIIINHLFSEENKLFERHSSSEVIKKTAFILSLILFSFGGVIALFIDKVNVTIPAHYHGSIVGISIAFMGYIYLVINKIFSPINYKTAIYQLITYAIGQMMHISALAYSGGYGALRKTPGVDLPLQAKIAMGFMGAGGLIAISGGLIFVYICSKSIFMNKRS